MKPISLFGTGLTSYSSVVTAQRRLNCFYDLRPDQDKAPIVIRGTPGAYTWVTLPTYPIRGWLVVGSTLYVVAGQTLYSVTTGGAFQARGTMPTVNRNVDMESNGVHILIVDGVTAYFYTFSNNLLLQVTDANFPAGATTVAFLDQRFIVEKPGTREFYVSQLLDGSDWTPQVFATKESSSDLLLSVDATSDVLILYGQKSIEFWQNVGTSPNPYQRINGATQPWGVAAVNSIANLGKTQIFLAQNAQGGVQVMHLRGTAPDRVSTSDIENIFSSFTTYTDAIALTYMVDGHPMYQLTFPAADRSFLYDASTSMWSETQTGLDLQARHFGNLGIAFNSKNYISDTTTGNIYQLDVNTYTDNGTPIKRQVRSRHVRDSGNVLFVADVQLEMETGVGVQSGQGSDPMVMMQVSKDGGQTFGPERWRSLGRVGQYTSRVRWDRLGGESDYVFQFTMSDPVKFVITNGEATIRPSSEV